MSDTSSLKRQMENALAAFHRIPAECDLDRVECAKRIRRMVETRLRYQDSAKQNPEPTAPAPAAAPAVDEIFALHIHTP